MKLKANYQEFKACIKRDGINNSNPRNSVPICFTSQLSKEPPRSLLEMLHINYYNPTVDCYVTY